MWDCIQYHMLSFHLLKFTKHKKLRWYSNWVGLFHFPVPTIWSRHERHTLWDTFHPLLMGEIKNNCILNRHFINYNLPPASHSRTDSHSPNSMYESNKNGKEQWWSVTPLRFWYISVSTFSFHPVEEITLGLHPLNPWMWNILVKMWTRF